MTHSLDCRKSEVARDRLHARPVAYIFFLSRRYASTCLKSTSLPTLCALRPPEPNSK